MPTELPLVPGALLLEPFVHPPVVFAVDVSVPGDPAHIDSVNACPESERDDDADIGDDLDDKPISDDEPPDDVKGGKLV